MLGVIGVLPIYDVFVL